MKKKISAFTIVELLVVIVIIGILATIVTLNLGNSQKRAADRKAIANVNLIAGALDQYSISNGRSYPVISTSPTALNSEEITDTNTIKLMLKDYLSEIPVSDSKYKYIYLYNQTGSKAAVVFDNPQSSRDGICNYNSLTAPALVVGYKNSGGDVCYYVAK